ncbi:MAG: DUF3570 domain-containing protein [Gammaproteobacteria bacterium]|jgi:hypothetical protein|nr:DUF3570 domain-containing protein [Gammaproteobacteria bacterium]
MNPAKKNITAALSAAVCSLLATPGQAETGDWDIDSAILYYSETDRVTAVEPVISATRDLGDDESLSLKMVFDSLSGASANGAVPSTMPQTFTSPSGGGGHGGDDDEGEDDEGGGGAYTVAPNETPLDDTFKDERIAFSLNWQKPVDRNNRSNLGLSLSSENDFFSLGANALWQHDLNQKNTTLSYGVNFEFDTIEPIGGAPVPLSSMIDQLRQPGSETREIVDLIVGVTQVINRTSLFQVNLSLSQADGYMTDPYKFVSVVGPDGEPIDQLFENRPDTRMRQSVFGKYKKRLDGGDILTASYRYMTDDWQIDSHTYDLTWRFAFSRGFFVEPHLRYYQQSAAEFYRYFLLDTETPPEFVSADYRLGDLDTTTVGFKLGRDLGDGQAWSVRLEQYLQSGESSPDEAIGQLQQQDLFPDVEALIVQFNYSVRW